MCSERLAFVHGAANYDLSSEAASPPCCWFISGRIRDKLESPGPYCAHSDSFNGPA
jgi:hypothetical protein